MEHVGYPSAHRRVGHPPTNIETATVCTRISLGSTPVIGRQPPRGYALSTGSGVMLRHVVAAVFLCGILTVAGLLAPAVATAQVLDRVEIVETPDTAEIHI